uniref:Protein kinase domain-containing protein n=1 Tax=Rodentolepis nana TaxID=102285 RepID=A0A158QJ78_RODNA
LHAFLFFQEPKTEKKFHVELHFSPGAHALCRDLPTGSGFRPGRREMSLLSSSTSLAETSFDSASEHTGGCFDLFTPHTPPPPSQHTTITPIAPSSNQGRKRVPKSSVSCCRPLCIDRSLPSDLHEVGRTSERPNTASSTTTAKGPNRSHYEKHRKSQRVSRQTSTAYCPPEIVSGLCYADVVNQDAVIGHRSRMQELWFENMRSVNRQNRLGFKVGSERSMSSGPMVEHALTFSSFLQTDSNPIWHEKTLTTLCQPLQRSLRSENGNVTLPLSRPISANLSQTHGRFTITSSLDTPTAVWKPPTYGNPQSPSWFTDSIDIEDDDIQTTGEPEQVSTSHSTLDLHPSTPPFSYPSPKPFSKALKQLSVKSRHLSATIPFSPVKWRGHRGLSPPSLAIRRRMSLGDQPPEFHSLQNKFPGILTAAGGEEPAIGGSSGNLGAERGDIGDDASGTVTQVYTSLDSVKPDRAQELFNQGAPVAQWLMEYFDQIEKAKWSKPESQADDTERNSGGARKPVGYKPILSAADYLKADACASSTVSKPNDQESRRDSVDEDQFTKEKSDEHQRSSNAEDTHTEASTSIAATLSDLQQFEVATPELILPEPRARKSAPTAMYLDTISKGENISRHSSHTDVMDGMEPRELNALTYPNYHMHIDLKELHQCPLGKETRDNASPYYKRRHRGLISTAVIRGSRDTYSNSVPDLIQLLNCSLSDGPSQTETPQNPAEMMVPSAPSVPEIYPLETLHNAMTLHQLESFFTGLTTHKFRSPFTKGNNGIDSDGEDRVSPAELAVKLKADSSCNFSLSPSFSSKFQAHNLERPVPESTREGGAERKVDYVLLNRE